MKKSRCGAILLNLTPTVIWASGDRDGKPVAAGAREIVFHSSGHLVCSDPDHWNWLFPGTTGYAGGGLWNQLKTPAEK